MKKIFRGAQDVFRKLGPGFITGAADDDPSGIATYSIAGAQFGYGLLWMTSLMIPMMIAVQEMCGRIGMTSGMGLAGVIRKNYSRKLLFTMVTLLAIANVINIGADLGAMAASMEMIAGLRFYAWLILVTLITIIMEVFIPYKRYAPYLKWMAFSLLVYAVTAVITTNQWRTVLYYTFIPHLQWNSMFFMTMVGFLGTTISPYLFFWQAGEEIEEEISDGKIKDFDQSPHTLQKEVRRMQHDTTTGMIFSNLISFFIILTTANTLNQHGITSIDSPQAAAAALAPLAGKFSSLLFTVGIIGIGLQSVPVLAGSLAYACAESFGFREGLAKQLTKAKAFYATIAIATAIGAGMNVIGIKPIQALYYAAIVNALTAIPLIFLIIVLADNRKVVGKFTTHPINRKLALVTGIAMSLAAVVMIADMLI